MSPATPSLPYGQSCALRALTLCDGQNLEDSPDAVVVCLCWLEAQAQELGDKDGVEWAQRMRAQLTPPVREDGASW